jgi:hypothetical protein
MKINIELQINNDDPITASLIENTINPYIANNPKLVKDYFETVLQKIISKFEEDRETTEEAIRRLRQMAGNNKVRVSTTKVDN